MSIIAIVINKTSSAIYYQFMTLSLYKLGKKTKQLRVH